MSIVGMVNGMQQRWRWLVFFHGIREANGKAWSVYWSRGEGVPLWATGRARFSWRRWWGHQRRELARALVRWLAEEDDDNVEDT